VLAHEFPGLVFGDAQELLHFELGGVAGDAKARGYFRSPLKS
jgi:hypothetical protein